VDRVASAGIPDGIPVGRALDLPPHLLADDLYQAVRAISQVHGDGVLPVIPVFLRPGLPVRGTFIERAGTPVATWIKADARHRGFALLHEVGHFLDLVGLGRPGSFASSGDDPVLANWRRAVEQSDAAQRLGPMIRALVDALPSGDVEQRRALLVQLDPKEFWARSYAQYVAVQSDEPGLLRALDAARTPISGKVYYPRQWSNEDFLPIHEAIDTTFRRTGWRSQRPRRRGRARSAE
jgi:hypothetical protein